MQVWKQDLRVLTRGGVIVVSVDVRRRALVARAETGEEFTLIAPTSNGGMFSLL